MLSRTCFLASARSCSLRLIFFAQIDQVALQNIAPVFAQVDDVRAQQHLIQSGNWRRLDVGDLNIRENIGDRLAQAHVALRIGVRRADAQCCAQ